MRTFSLVCFLVLLSLTANAKPEYAVRENHACGYCHVNPNPGRLNPDTKKVESTDRNARGIYYGSHNHSLNGYVEPVAPVRKKLPDLFRFVGKMDFTDNPRRMAMGDVTGDGKARLVLLHEKAGSPNAAQLTVRLWNGKDFTTEFTGEVQASPERLAVGKFAEGRPAIILTGDAAWVWSGKTFVRKPSSQPLPLFGSVRMKTGEERVLLAEGDTPKAYRIKVNPTGIALADPVEAPRASQVSVEDFNAPAEKLQKAGLPEALAGGGLLGLWEVQDKTFLYIIKIDQDFDAVPDPDNPKSPKPKLLLKDKYSYISVSDPLDLKALPLWGSPRMKGVVYDVARENPQGDRRLGLLVLTSDSYQGKARTLYYFALE